MLGSFEITMRPVKGSGKSNRRRAMGGKSTSRGSRLPVQLGGHTMRLKDKVAIITGAAHGMGEAEARLFAAEGAKVIVADILADEAARVAATIIDGRGAAISAKIDVTNEAEWKSLIDKTLTAYGRLDVLVNNAGISGSSVGDPDGLDGWHRIIAVN